MKKLFFCIVVLGMVGMHVSAQDLLGFEVTAGNDRIDYKIAGPKALEAARFLLSNAIDTDKLERDKAITNMLIWMENTPEYVFYIDENIYSFTNSSKNLLAVYLACMTQLSLENPALANDRNALKLSSVELYIDYCLKPGNHVKPFRQLDQLVKARDRADLKSYIKD